MLRPLLLSMALLASPALAQETSPSAPALEFTDLHVTRDTFQAQLATRLQSLAASLKTLQSDAPGISNPDLLALEISALRRQKAHLENQVEHLEESFLHFQENLSDTIETLQPFTGSEDVDLAIAAFKSGNLPLADQQLARLDQSQTVPPGILAEALFLRGKLSDDLGDYRLALPHYQRAISLTPQNRRYLERAGATASQMGFYAQAVQYAEEALALPSTQADQQDASDSTLFNNLGDAREDLADYTRALEYYQIALASARSEHGSNSPQTATALKNLGSLQATLAHYDNSLTLLQQALTIFEEIDPNSLETARCLLTLSSVHQSLAHYTEASNLLARSIEIDLQNGAKGQTELANKQRALADLYDDLARYDEALELLEYALETHRLNLGDDHPSVARDLNLLGILNKRLGHYETALEYYQKALKSDLKTFGPDHPNITRIHQGIASCFFKQGKSL